jgi:HEAT repeat protein
MRKTIRFSVSICLTLCLASLAYGAAKPVKPKNFKGTKWIWSGTDKGNPAVSVPGATRYFRRDFELGAGVKAKAGHILITCDNLFTLYVNGEEAGRGAAGADAWRSPRIIDVSEHLRDEKNSVAVAAVNTIPGPAALIVKLILTLEEGEPIEIVSDEKWTSGNTAPEGWRETGFSADDWVPAKVAGTYGCAPWRTIGPGGVAGGRAAPPQTAFKKETEFKDPVFRDGVVFVRGYIGFTSHDRNNYIQRIRGTRAYFESDTATPAAIGRQLLSLIPLRPDGRLTLLCDAGGGMIGSPSVSYDGKTVFFSLARRGEAFYQVYAVAPDGSDLRPITKGPFHHFDPMELPDGRIVFSSTRIGSREEYHGNPAFSLFACDPDGKNVRPVTYHIVWDREPRVTAKGSLAFIRGDNFLERAKVETQIHETRLDGTGGQVILGPGRKGIGYHRSMAAESNSKWLRRYGFGSPAPLAHGQVAAISHRGLVTSAEQVGVNFGPGSFLPYDFSPLPDGRLLCTGIRRGKILILDPREKEVIQVVALGELELPDPGEPNMTRGYAAGNLHSVVHLGSRPKPQMPPSLVDKKVARGAVKTGYLYCQNVLDTHHKSADLSRIKAIRVYEGRPFTLNPTMSIYVHIGVEGVELGTAPLAPDGSFYVEVPADRPLALQAVDAEGRSVINELTWIYTRPGEQRACVGCHVSATVAPTMIPSLSVRSKPLALTGQGDPHRFRANNGANGGVLNMQLDRFREAANINQQRQGPLVAASKPEPLPPGRPMEVEGLLKLASGDDLGLKISSVRRLGIFRDRRAVPVLIGALDDKCDEVRCAAVVALAACGNREAVPPLLDALSDKHPAVAQGAHVALEHLTGHSGDFNAFANDARKGIAEWRAWIQANSWDSVEKALCARLAANDAAKVQLAIEALGHVGGGRAKTALREYLKANATAGELRLSMAAMRALGHLKDKQAVPLLAQTLRANMFRKEGRGFMEVGFHQKPIYLAATAAEALGWIGTPEAEKILVEIFPKLLNFENYTHRCGDHSWLMGCNSCPIHYRILESLDAMGSKVPAAMVPKMLKSVPMDKDRALLHELDGYETLTARVLQRSGHAPAVIETCLSVLGDEAARPIEALKSPASASPHAERHIRKLTPQARAAQTLSVVCLDTRYAERIRQALTRFRKMPASENRSWTYFFLARTLGNLRDPASAELLVDVILNDPSEASLGRNTPPTHIIHKAMRPFHRAAAAWSLGEIGDKRAVPALLKVVQSLQNAASVRQQAAIALGKIRDPGCLNELKKISADYPEEITRRALLASVLQLEQRR